MSWIQQNKFVAGLIAVTVVLSGLLLYFGGRGSSRYKELLSEFQEASAQVTTFERLALYPSQENLDGKTKALADYETSIGDLKSGFEKFQEEDPEQISPQEFSNRLVATNESITSRLRAAAVEMPDGFYSGFENYTTGLAQSGATSVLTRQLGIVDAVMDGLAAAKPGQILNFRREGQPEEGGLAYQAKAGDIVRPHSFELTFRGTEASARRFLTSLADKSERLVVIRTLRIRNENGDAPKSSAAQFAPATGAAAAADGGVAFFNAFDAFLDDEDQTDSEVADAEALPPEAAPPASAPRNDGARMLGQVAGNEFIEVFIRFDVMEFLPQSDVSSDDES